MARLEQFLARPAIAFWPARERPRESPEFAYRLRSWPALRASCRTAGVLQALTRMEIGPVSRRWFITTSRLAPQDGGSLLDELVQRGYVDELKLLPREDTA